MDAVIGWVVIGSVAYLVFRAVRKWRREWRSGITAVSSAAEAAASAVAHADAGGVHLHVHTGGGVSADGRNLDYDDVVDIAGRDDDDRAAEVRRIVSRLADLLASNGAGSVTPALGSSHGVLPVGDARGSGANGSGRWVR